MAAKAVEARVGVTKAVEAKAGVTGAVDDGGRRRRW